MSSFVTGLVRRAAGIPQPVLIRPAVGPAAEVGASGQSVAENACETLVRNRHIP